MAGQGIGTLDGQGNFHAVVNNSRNSRRRVRGNLHGRAELHRRFLLEGAESGRFVIIDNGSWYAVSVFEGITLYTVATRIHPGYGNAR